MKRVISIIVGLLKDRVSVDSFSTSKRAKIKKIIKNNMQWCSLEGWKHIGLSILSILMLLPIPIKFYWKIESTLSHDIFLFNNIQLYDNLYEKKFFIKFYSFVTTTK